ncbi:4831_t:CDS:2 [Ambispora gerdemannii]|uniref:4831_t:CDS:1 n=1 Tax=Ambispora gerdemannii TaxID=144530 RepID=A0A9N8ZXJ7_9GLOM|nr:4831_t:CDS:2 [Ambispora gerdemannii]
MEAIGHRYEAVKEDDYKTVHAEYRRESHSILTTRPYSGYQKVKPKITSPIVSLYERIIESLEMFSSDYALNSSICVDKSEDSRPDCLLFGISISCQIERKSLYTRVDE